MSQEMLLVPPAALLQQHWDSFAATAPMKCRSSGSHWWSFSISSSPGNAQVYQVTSGVADSSSHPIILLVNLASAARAPEPCEDWTSITSIIFTGAEQYLAGQKSNTHNAHQMWASSTSHFPHESQEKLHPGAWQDYQTELCLRNSPLWGKKSSSQYQLQDPRSAISLLKKSSWSHPSLVLSFHSPESALSKKAWARLMGLGNGGSQTLSLPRNHANTFKFNCRQGWAFSMKLQPHVLIFIYASPQQKAKQGRKEPMREAKQMCFESSSRTWHEIRWIQERVEPSLPTQEIPSTLLRLPDGNQVCWHVGANSARHHSFISDGNRFYNARITCWFFPPSQAHPRGEAGSRQSIIITPPGAKQLPGH